MFHISELRAVPVKDLTSPIVLTFMKKPELENGTNTTCNYWDHLLMVSDVATHFVFWRQECMVAAFLKTDIRKVNHSCHLGVHLIENSFGRLKEVMACFIVSTDIIILSAK